MLSSFFAAAPAAGPATEECSEEKLHSLAGHFRVAASAIEARLSLHLEAERTERASALATVWRSLEKQQLTLSQLAGPETGVEAQRAAERERQELFGGLASIHGDVEALRATVMALLSDTAGPKAKVPRLECSLAELRSRLDGLAGQPQQQSRGLALPDSSSRGGDAALAEVRALASELAKHGARGELERRSLLERVERLETGAGSLQRQDAKLAAEGALRQKALEEGCQRLHDKAMASDEASVNLVASLRKELAAQREELRAAWRTEAAQLRVEIEGLRRCQGQRAQEAMSPELKKLEQAMTLERQKATEKALEAERVRFSRELAEARAAFVKLVEANVAGESKRIHEHVAAEVARTQARLDAEALRLERRQDAATAAARAAEKAAVQAVSLEERLEASLEAAGAAQRAAEQALLLASGAEAATAAAQRAEAAAAQVRQLDAALQALAASTGRKLAELEVQHAGHATAKERGISVDAGEWRQEARLLDQRLDVLERSGRVQQHELGTVERRLEEVKAVGERHERTVAEGALKAREAEARLERVEAGVVAEGASRAKAMQDLQANSAALERRIAEESTRGHELMQAALERRIAEAVRTAGPQVAAGGLDAEVTGRLHDLREELKAVERALQVECERRASGDLGVRQDVEEERRARLEGCKELQQAVADERCDRAAELAEQRAEVAKALRLLHQQGGEEACTMEALLPHQEAEAMTPEGNGHRKGSLMSYFGLSSSAERRARAGADER